MTIVLLAALASLVPASAADPRSRVIVLADMGHDPDDEQQIVHMLAMSNALAIEGLVTATGRFFRPDPPIGGVKTLMPKLFHDIIDGYAKVYPNLQRHAKGWPTPGYLHSIVADGQPGNDMAAVGAGKSSAGSRLIIDAATRPDPRPLHIIINAGANTLAQALFDYRSRHGEAATATLVSKLIVYDNSGQDDAGAWICHEFPDIHWVRGGHQNRGFGGYSNTILGPHVWQPYPYSPVGQHAWAKEHIQTGHGALGAAYPDRTVGTTTHFIAGGGAIPWIGLAMPGLTDPTRPSWGGWSGRYTAWKAVNPLSAFEIVAADEARYFPFRAYTDTGIADSWTDPDTGLTHLDPFTPVWRWRKAMWNDLRARMDWSVAAYADANHHPVAVLNGDASDAILYRRAKPGESIPLSAAGSRDPDGDGLVYRWWVYLEAGDRPYRRTTSLTGADTAAATLTVPPDAAGRDLHVILEIWDDAADIPLVDYRRLVVEVR